MAVKFLDNTGLGYFWSKIKAWCNATFAAIAHTHTSYAVKHSYTTAANAAKNWYRIANANTSQTDTTKPIHAQFILTAYNASYDAGYYERWFIDCEVFGRTSGIRVFGNTNAPFSQARILYENTIADLDANDRPAIDIYLNHVLANGTTKIEIEEVYNQGWTFVADGQISASTIPTGFESVACDSIKTNGVGRSTYSDYSTYIGLQRSNITSNTTLADKDTYRSRVLNCTGTITITVPSINSAYSWFIIKNFNTTSGVITVHPSTTSVLIDGSNANITLQPGEYIMIHSKAANAYTIVFDGRWKSKKADKATTLAGYGITDAKIANGTITLGSNSITPLTSVPNHNQASNTINTMTGYSKASSEGAIGTSDTLNQAIGKLEYKIDNVAENIGDTTPVGTILYFAADTAPEGFLVCDGTAVSRSLYSDLFDVIGTTYGSGDGSTTFNLPNLVNKFAEGAVTNIGDSINAGLPNITGRFGSGEGSRYLFAPSSSGAFQSVSFAAGNDTWMQNEGSERTGDITFDASRSSSIYGNSNTVQPPALKLLPCIKAISTSSSNEEATVESLIEGFKEEIEEKFEQLAPKDPLPIGSIVHFASGTVPVGYLVCDGSAVSRTTYSALFNVIGITYGSGDGSTTFNVPNLIGRFLEGANTGVGTSVNAGLPNITGTATFVNSDGVENTIYPDSGALFFTQNPSTIQTVNQVGSAKRDLRIDASRSSAIYGNSSTVQPNSVKLLPCIKASYTSLADANAVANFQTTVSNINENLVHKTFDETVNGWKTFNDGIKFGSTVTLTSNSSGTIYTNSELQIQNNSANQIRLVHGNYGVLFRNDGSDFYLLQTAQSDPWGSWNSYRPYQLTLSTGEMQFTTGSGRGLRLRNDGECYWYGHFRTAGPHGITNPDIIKGTNPNENKYLAFYAADKNGLDFAANCLGMYETRVQSDGNTYTYIRAMKNEANSTSCGELGVVYYKSNNYTHAYCPTPDWNAGNREIPNAWWVLNKCVTIETEQNVTGYKKFWKDLSLYYFGYNLETGNITEDRWWSLGLHTGDTAIVGGLWKCLRASDNCSYISLRTYRYNGDGSYAAFHVGKEAGGTGYCNLTNVSNVRPQSNGAATLGLSGTRWGVLYTTSNVSVSSDERIKTQISAIPDGLLDAWENLDYKQFKMIDSIEEKGDKARLHTGNIAQDVDRIFKNAGLEARDYGFFCWDEWEAKEASYDEEGQLVDSAQEAGDLYSLRYGELLCIEAAYQRRKNKILENRISELEKQVSGMLQILQNLTSSNG